MVAAQTPRLWRARAPAVAALAPQAAGEPRAGRAEGGGAVRFCVDLDGTLDSFTAFFIPLLAAIKQADPTGAQVWVTVLTGVDHDPPVRPEEFDEKRQYLNELGYGQLYDELVLVARPHDENKAMWVTDNDARALIDNSKANVKAMPASCLGLLCWQTREDGS